jgi:APA family basic amino acid/polyamine antiporter
VTVLERRLGTRDAVGLTGCLVLAVTLPLPSVLAGLAVFALGAAVWATRIRSRPGGVTG